MKKEKIEVIRYELGDVLDVSKVFCESTSSHSKKAPGFNSAKIALVLSETTNRDNSRNYTILCDNLKIYTMKAIEMGEEKYLKHIDLESVFNLTGENDGDTK